MMTPQQMVMIRKMRGGERRGLGWRNDLSGHVLADDDVARVVHAFRIARHELPTSRPSRPVRQLSRSVNALTVHERTMDAGLGHGRSATVQREDMRIAAHHADHGRAARREANSRG